MSLFELREDERGKTYVLKETLRVLILEISHKTVLAYPGFEHDLDTFVINLPDEVPPTIHDFLYAHRIFEDGTPCSRKQADLYYYKLNQRSSNPGRRKRAIRTYIGVRLCGWIFWYRRKAIPIPENVKHLYGSYS